MFGGLVFYKEAYGKLMEKGFLVRVSKQSTVSQMPPAVEPLAVFAYTNS